MRKIEQAMRAEIKMKDGTIKISNLVIRLEEAKLYLVREMPICIRPFIIKKETQHGTIVNYVDWQGCLLDRTVKAILFLKFNRELNQQMIKKHKQ